MAETAMNSQHATDYLRLSQFLELQSQWLKGLSQTTRTGPGDHSELAHRICRTAVILLDPVAVAIGVATDSQPYRILAADGAWSLAGNGASSAPASAAATTMAARALATHTAQLKSRGDVTDGIFPFSAGPQTRGCMHIRIDRPLFDGTEVSFLRFLASATGIVLAGGLVSLPSPPPDPNTQDPEHVGDAYSSEPDEEQARRYVAMVVHDLRNPLNVVSGYSGLLNDGSLGPLTDQQSEAVTAISRQVTSLLGVIEQLIDLDGLLSPTGAPAVETFELRSLFEDIRSSCFPHADARISWPGPESVFEFTTDRRRLFSVVQNLVDNALKHTSNSPVLVDCTRHRGELIISVADRGAGLAPQHQATLLGQGPSTSDPTKRSGIGLYAVGTYTRVLGGRITIDSADGGGTKINVQLPKLSPSSSAS